MYVPEKPFTFTVFLEYFRNNNSDVCVPEKSLNQSAILKKFFISSQLYFLNILRILILVYVFQKNPFTNVSAKKVLFRFLIIFLEYFRDFTLGNQFHKCPILVLELFCDIFVMSWCLMSSRIVLNQ